MCVLYEVDLDRVNELLARVGVSLKDSKEP